MARDRSRCQVEAANVMESSWRILMLRNQTGCDSACSAMWPNDSCSGAPAASSACALSSLGSSCGCW